MEIRVKMKIEVLLTVRVMRHELHAQFRLVNGRTIRCQLLTKIPCHKECFLHTEQNNDCQICVRHVG